MHQIPEKQSDPQMIKRKLLVTRGLPASGKSTWAIKYVQENGNTIRINNDSLSNMLFGEAWVPENYKIIDKSRMLLIEKHLADGKHDIIVDNTNLTEKNIVAYQKLADEHGYVLEIKDFRHVPVETCIARNRARLNAVPDKVIYEMYRTHVYKEPVPLPIDPTLPNAIIVDIDGTIAKMVTRGCYENTAEKYLEDEPIEQVLNIVRRYISDHTVIFLTGRQDSVREATEQWLEQKAGFKKGSYHLFMRTAGKRQIADFVFKREVAQNEIIGKYNISFWIEDRIRNVEMARQLGITAIQVGEGNF